MKLDFYWKDYGNEQELRRAPAIKTLQIEAETHPRREVGFHGKRRATLYGPDDKPLKPTR